MVAAGAGAVVGAGAVTSSSTLAFRSKFRTTGLAPSLTAALSLTNSFDSKMFCVVLPEFGSCLL